MDTNDLYKLAEDKGISVYSYSIPEIYSLSVKDTDGDYHVAISNNAIASPTTEKTCLAHEISHCETDALYAPDAPLIERNRMEYRADKRTVEYLVPWDLYVMAFKEGYFTAWEQADFWGILEQYVPVVHKVYERTRWEDVEKLKSRYLNDI